jgi:hypothetical protein
MNSIEFSTRFFQAAPGSGEAAALVRDLVEEARYPAYHAVERYLSSAEEPERMKGKNVLSELHELALVPLAESAAARELADEVWAMRTLAEELVEFRVRAGTVLKGLLANRKPAAAAPEGAPYPTPAGARVCDLSFILLSRMLHVELSASAFLGMPRLERDARIKEFQKSRIYRSTFEPKS